MKTGATKNPTLNCAVAVHSKHQNKQEVRGQEQWGTYLLCIGLREWWKTVDTDPNKKKKKKMKRQPPQKLRCRNGKEKGRRTQRSVKALVASISNSAVSRSWFFVRSWNRGLEQFRISTVHEVLTPGQSEPAAAPSKAPVGRSVHRMSCVFSSGSLPWVNQHCTTVNLFMAIFSQPSPPYYPPTSLNLRPMYQVPINPPKYLPCIFSWLNLYFSAKPLSLLK
jgi:hypothetical protein